MYFELRQSNQRKAPRLEQNFDAVFAFQHSAVSDLWSISGSDGSMAQKLVDCGFDGVAVVQAKTPAAPMFDNGKKSWRPRRGTEGVSIPRSAANRWVRRSS